MTQWIGAITRGHNGGACLLKDGKVVFAIEEERLSRQKYDGGPLAAMMKFLDYTDKLDYLVIAHTQPLDTAGTIDFTGGDMYTGLAKKLGLIDRSNSAYDENRNHKQVIDLSFIHHKLHASCAFYRSGFESAVAVVVDGAGSFIPMNIGGEEQMTWELESIFECKYANDFKTIYKHQGSRGPHISARISNMSAERESEKDSTFELVLDDTAGITKAYEAVTQYCGWQPIEAGKTMGLFPYGQKNDKFPDIYTTAGGDWLSADRHLIIPTYPNGAVVNEGRYPYLQSEIEPSDDATKLQNRRDMAYAVQTESQQAVLDLIMYAVEKTGNKNVVLSGGYALNCVANYWYLPYLNEKGIKLYVEPVSNDAGTAMGAALLIYHDTTNDDKIRDAVQNVYDGFEYNYTNNQIEDIVLKYGAEITDTDNDSVVELLSDRNIVTIFQGRSENGPRALGNRSILYDPTDPDGKDHVNKIKRREYFRPFAGTILAEHAHEWFDMRGLDESPFMMYAMNCQPGIEEKIPSIIHIDGTCRIQTVTRDQNPNYYDLIETWYKKSGVPIIFNTSFNLGGEPLVETLDDAVRTLYSSDIEYLYLPEYGKLITLKND